MQLVQFVHLRHDNAKQRAVRHHEMRLGRECSLPLASGTEHSDIVKLHRGLGALKDEGLQLQLGLLLFEDGYHCDSSYISTSLTKSPSKDREEKIEPVPIVQVSIYDSEEGGQTVLE